MSDKLLFIGNRGLGALSYEPSAVKEDTAEHTMTLKSMFEQAREMQRGRNSAHIPLPEHALLDAMEAFFEMMIDENSASVRAILGHHIFTYIHPYPDGNGRIGRFIMNFMLVSGRLPWSIIEVDKRDVYMKALEEASVTQNIGAFAKFVYEICAHESRKILTYPFLDK